MIDYSHIPMHVRITERWKIDPGYDDAVYYRNLDRRGSDCVLSVFREWPRVPEMVLEYASRIGGQGAGFREWTEIAGAVRVLPEDFREMVRAYRARCLNATH